MKKPIKAVLLGIIIGIGLVFLSLYIGTILVVTKLTEIPETEYTYVREHEFNSLVSYTLVYDDSVRFLTVNPECESKNPWDTCEVLTTQIMEIESIETEGNSKIYTLYYKSPGEKGSQYRKTLIQNADSIEQEGRVSEKTSYSDMRAFIYLLRAY